MSQVRAADLEHIRQGIPDEIPPMPDEEPGIPHAPARPLVLTEPERILAVRNALRYVPVQHHAVLAPEFALELAKRGRIYMYRYRPPDPMRARPISEYPARCRQAAAIMLMIQNNLDPQVAQHPYELITYGGNGTVFQNWAQYRLVMRYLSEMSEDQTLVLYSGHPLGLFPSHPEAPRVVVTNGMVVPNYSSPNDYLRLAALGVTLYGQMTAGSFMYIGPQGIVHGTTITLLNAGRLTLGLGPDDNLAGKLFVTSGLGGMSGAQAKAAIIAGAVTIIAEVNPQAVKKRLDQGWLMKASEDLDDVLSEAARAIRERRPLSIGYQGNVVDLWEQLVDPLHGHGLAVHLGSDQTSLHNPYGGGYYPVGISFDEANRLMVQDPDRFKSLVQKSLRRQVIAIMELRVRGMYFWDYGNALLLEASRAGVPGLVREDGSFALPSYVESILGPMCFDYGFGPFRWVCCSGDPQDLVTTDRIAMEVLEEMTRTAAPEIRQQVLDNVRWIREAGRNNLVVGSQARILYADRRGRIQIAQAFNGAIARGRIKGPIVLGRDHHDVSGTDSPFRETANIRDGSMFCADMAVQNVVGGAVRGATWVSLHNGGGVGWGEAINGGFGFVLDGTGAAAERVESMLTWDVSNGLARRAWARNPGAISAARQAVEDNPGMQVTMPVDADEALVTDAVQRAFRK